MKGPLLARVPWVPGIHTILDFIKDVSILLLIFYTVITQQKFDLKPVHYGFLSLVRGSEISFIHDILYKISKIGVF